MAKANPVRFSTKYQDDETDQLYYGYRYLNTTAGRWVSRDPIGEKGGLNEYALLNNQVVGKVDVLGRRLLIEPSASPEFKRQMLRCLCTLGGSDHGYKLIKGVEALGETWVIKPEASDNAPSTTDQDVYMDPRSVNGVGPTHFFRRLYPREMVPESIIGCAIVLGHELGHVLGEADEYWPIEIEARYLAGERQPGPDNHNVEKNENPLRRFFGVPVRTHYHGAGPIPARD